MRNWRHHVAGCNQQRGRGGDWRWAAGGGRRALMLLEGIGVRGSWRPEDLERVIACKEEDRDAPPPPPPPPPPPIRAICDCLTTLLRPATTCALPIESRRSQHAFRSREQPFQREPQHPRHHQHMAHGACRETPAHSHCPPPPPPQATRARARAPAALRPRFPLSPSIHRPLGTRIPGRLRTGAPPRRRSNRRLKRDICGCRAPCARHGGTRGAGCGTAPAAQKHEFETQSEQIPSTTAAGAGH